MFGDASHGESVNRIVPRYGQNPPSVGPDGVLPFHERLQKPAFLSARTPEHG